MSAVDARFVPLEEMLRPQAIPDMKETPAVAPVAEDVLSSPYCSPPDIAETVRAARVFHATLADALTSTCARLLRDIAADVLARELRLAPADVAAIVERVIAECPDEPVRVRVSPCDADRICGFPVIRDATLQAGDAIVEFEHGNVDARLGVRLADVLIAATL